MGGYRIFSLLVGGGSNAIGLFHEFVDEPTVRMIGVEAAKALRPKSMQLP